jgi:GDP-D-mannose 3',5'-epimerase
MTTYRNQVLSMESPLISTVLDRLQSEKLNLSWFQKKRILVTGGAGFIGSWLVEALVRLGADVSVVDNLWRGSIHNLESGSGEYWIPMDTHFFQSDICDYALINSAIKKTRPDFVYHLADIVAGIDFVFSNELFVYNANTLINTNTFKAVQENHIPGVVYVGTACSYPKSLQTKPGGRPLVEDQVYPADPESAYGWSKLMGEYEANLLAQNTSTEVGILRLQNVYGPRSILSRKRSQVIPSLIRKAILHPEEEFVVWGTGKQSRDFVFVGDVVDALLRIALLGMNKDVLQIGTAKETTVAELANLIIKTSGKDISVHFDSGKPEGDGGRCGDFSRARDILGWNVFTCLEDGIRQTYVRYHRDR